MRFKVKPEASKSSKPGDCVGQFVCIRVTRDQPSDDSSDWVRSVVEDDVWSDPAPGPRGPAGESIVGPAGKDGSPGQDARGWQYQGEWKPATKYRVDDIVTRDGSSYLCLKMNTDREPPGRQWARIAAAGKDGRDGADGISQRGPRGLAGTTTVVAGDGTPATPFIADADIEAGMALRVGSVGGHCDLASASNIGTAAVVGLCVVDVASGLAGIMQTGDVLTLDDWTDATGSATLSPGLAYYAAEASGQLTTTPPVGAGKCVTFVGRALDGTSLAIELATPILLSEEPEE